MTQEQLKRMEQRDLIKLIDSGQLILSDDMNAITDAAVRQGYAVVTQAYLEQCKEESEELVRLKIREVKRKESGIGVTVGGGNR